MSEGNQQSQGLYMTKAGNGTPRLIHGVDSPVLHSQMLTQCCWCLGLANRKVG
ncbi:hypothetical protein HanIR_Chr13g0664931 [Helianthus annuus]|nr:hypothetical protein HanIR_Chr13g0664931 [Helianthus annuus]